MSMATELRAEFAVARGRDFRSFLETPSSLKGIPGGPGDMLQDRLRFALLDAWLVLSRNDDFHDLPVRVVVSLHPRSLELSIAHDPEGEN